MAKIPQGWTWRDEVVDGGPAVVFDIDGVLANADARQHFISPPNSDWKSFFQACDTDTVITETERLLRLIDDSVTVILLTGRPGDVQNKTIEWLQRNEMRWDALIMRTMGDYSKALAFKQQSVRRLKVEGFDLRLAFEDDPRNRDMFEAEGVPCMYIHSGYYERRDTGGERRAQ